MNRGIVALILALYAWSMLGVELYLVAAGPPTNELMNFRRMTMGRAVVGLGAAAILAAIVVAILGRKHRAPALAALALAAGWIATLASIWPI